MTLYLVISASTACFLGWLYWMLLPRVLPEVPYKKSSARRLLGDMPDVGAYAARTNQYSGAFFAINEELGAPVVQYLTTKFDVPNIVVNDPREVEDILIRRNREFDRADVTMDMFKSMLPEFSICQKTTPKLRAQKKKWADAMSTDFLRGVVGPRIQEAGEDLIKLWRLKAARMNGQPFQARQDLSDVAFDAIWASVLGSKLGITEAHTADMDSPSGRDKESRKTLSSASTVSDAVEYANQVIAGGVTSLWPNFYYWRQRLTPGFRRQMGIADAEINRIMLAACERFTLLSNATDESDKHDNCAMDLVLRREIARAKKAGEPPIDPTKDRGMKDEMFGMLGAGHESTANSMGWFVKLMASSPHVQKELRIKLQGVFHENSIPLASEILQANIPYLDGVIEETLRIGAPSAITTRQTTTNTKILGYDIPAGSLILLNLRILSPPLPIPEERRSATCQAANEKHVRAGLAGERARDFDQFEPRRWITYNEKDEEVFDSLSLPMLYFGGGLRGCFGKKLAMQELKILIVLLILNFEFLPIPLEVTGMDAHESIFRRPAQCFVKIREL